MSKGPRLMPEPALPEFKPRDISDDVTITIPAWMACMYMAEVRMYSGPTGAVEYINNAIKKTLYTQRTVNEQEALLEQQQEIAQFPFNFMRKTLGDDDDDPRR